MRGPAVPDLFQEAFVGSWTGERERTGDIQLGGSLLQRSDNHDGNHGEKVPSCICIVRFLCAVAFCGGKPMGRQMETQSREEQFC